MTTPLVYSVREPRCGGTHAIETIKTLYDKLHRGKKHLEYVDTHNMDAIRGIKPDQNIQIIRCDRRNLVEHFFSHIFLRYTVDFTNVRFYETLESHPTLVKALDKRVTITETEVQDYVGSRLRTHLRFLRNTENLNPITIYYEDWHKKFDIPSLGLYDIDLCNGMQYTKKLPDYKRTVFVNYDEVVHWIEKYKNDYTKIHNVEKLFEHWECNPSR